LGTVHVDMQTLCSWLLKRQTEFMSCFLYNLTGVDDLSQDVIHWSRYSWIQVSYEFHPAKERKKERKKDGNFFQGFLFTQVDGQRPSRRHLKTTRNYLNQNYCSRY
jgi:hypothetical protein